MAEIILYLTQADADEIREWVNAETCVAWIIEEPQVGEQRSWRAVDRLECIRPQSYAIWHRESEPLMLRSGFRDVPDTPVENPYLGWEAESECPKGTTPWIGGDPPGPYKFTFKGAGRESLGSLGRSGFHWDADRFCLIGHGAHPEAKRWWNRLRRFVRSHSTPVPWPDVRGSGRTGAYAFADAYREIRAGRAVDINP